jgi:hypothetical protein
VEVTVDAVNDPPIIEALDPVVAPVGSAPAFKIRAYDLESDAIDSRMPVKDKFTNQTIYAGINKDTLETVARPTEGAWDLTVGVFTVGDPLRNVAPFNISRFQLLEIGVGDRPLIATPETLEPTAGASTGTVRVATFRHGGTGDAASDFMAVVNWGDGSNREGSNGTNPPVTVVRSPRTPRCLKCARRTPMRGRECMR